MRKQMCLKSFITVFILLRNEFVMIIVIFGIKNFVFSKKNQFNPLISSKKMQNRLSQEKP